MGHDLSGGSRRGPDGAGPDRHRLEQAVEREGPAARSPPGRPSASTTTSESGSRMRNVVPTPGSESTSMPPPKRFTAARTTSRPTPRPETRLTSSLVENPGAKMRSRIEARSRRGDLALVEQARCERLGGDALLVEPAAVVGDLEDDVVPLLLGPQAQRAPGGLAPLGPHVGGLDPVVDGVAEQVHHRLQDLVGHAAVDLGGLARDLQLDRGAQVPRRLAHQPRQAGEHRARSAPCAPAGPAARGRRRCAGDR